MRFNIVVARPQVPDYNHSRCFEEVAHLFRCGLQDLGAQVIFGNDLKKDYINILLGYQFCFGRRLPEKYKCIIYQLEALSDREGWPLKMLETLRSPGCVVWDYAERNIEFLAERDIPAILKPLGFHPQMCRVMHSQSKDIDVLFYGTPNGRRDRILSQLEKIGKTKSLFDVYGEERDAWIGRSKIVLSVHFYKARLFDHVRLSYLMNNKVFSVIEDIPSREYEDLLVYAPYDRITEICQYYLENAELRTQTAERVFQKFSEYPESEFLRQALDQTLRHITMPEG